MTTSHRNILVIGATSSIAQSVCRVLARKGYGLVLCGRDEDELELLAADIKTRFDIACRWVVADVAEPGFSVHGCLARAGEFDDAIIAIGDMGNDNADDLYNIASVTAHTYTIPAQFAAALATHMAESGGGKLAIISSVAGDRGRKSNYVYGSAKAALTAFASGLRSRYARAGVHVMTIKPGIIDTSMSWGITSMLITSRENAAEKIMAAMQKNRDVVYVPRFWRFIMLIITHLPERVFKRLSL